MEPEIKSEPELILPDLLIKTEFIDEEFNINQDEIKLEPEVISAEVTIKTNFKQEKYDDEDTMDQVEIQSRPEEKLPEVAPTFENKITEIMNRNKPIAPRVFPIQPRPQILVNINPYIALGPNKITSSLTPLQPISPMYQPVPLEAKKQTILKPIVPQILLIPKKGSEKQKTVMLDEKKPVKRLLHSLTAQKKVFIKEKHVDQDEIKLKSKVILTAVTQTFDNKLNKTMKKNKTITPKIIALHKQPQIQIEFLPNKITVPFIPLTVQPSTTHQYVPLQKAKSTTVRNIAPKPSLLSKMVLEKQKKVIIDKKKLVDKLPDKFSKVLQKNKSILPKVSLESTVPVLTENELILSNLKRKQIEIVFDNEDEED